MADPTIPRVFTEAGDVEDIDLTGEKTGHLYPGANQQLDAIKNGLPARLDPSQGGSPGQLLLTIRRRPSDASSYRSRASSITVSDRGDELYIEARDAGGPEPHPPRSDSSVKAANLAEADNEDLWGRVKRLQCQSSEGPCFFPRGAIDRFFTPRVITKILQAGVRVAGGEIRNLERSKIEWYAERIRGTGRSSEKTSFIRILTILVLIEKQADITCFVDHGLSDADLPLCAVSDDNLVDLRHQGSDSSITCLADCNWSKRIHQEFDNNQWSVLSPYFTLGAGKKGKFYSLSKKDILPFTENSGIVQSGGYGEVSRVKIHECNHNFDDKKGHLGYFAVKRLKLSAEVTAAGKDATIDFDNLKAELKEEIEILNRFSGERDPHLVSLLASYCRENECCLIFHYAKGNLKELWEHTDPGSPLDEELKSLRWMLQQCRGIGGGISKIHVYTTSEISRDGEEADSDAAGQIYGRHGDIKPENILYFPGNPDSDQREDFTKATLVVADFGLARFHSDNTRTYFPQYPTPATPTYRPPECNLKGCQMSRSFDIWSLGCVLLEFITWYLGGWELVKSFVDKRKEPDFWMPVGFRSDQFYEFVRKKGTVEVLVRVKSKVHDFVDDLHAHEECSELIHQFLDYIMEKMLVVELKAPGIEQKRDVVDKVCQKLDELYQRLNERDFAGVASPRPKPLNSQDPPAVSLPPTIEPLKDEGRIEQLGEHTGHIIRSADTRR